MHDSAEESVEESVKQSVKESAKESAKEYPTKVQRVIFLIGPGQSSPEQIQRFTQDEKEFAAAIGKKMGKLRKSIWPGMGMTRAQFFIRPKEEPCTIGEAMRAPRLFVRPGISGLQLTNEEMIYVPRIQIVSGGLRLLPVKNHCIPIRPEEKSGGFIDCLLSKLCHLSGLCGEETTVRLSPAIRKSMEEPSEHLFDADRVIGAANSNRSLEIESSTGSTESKKETLIRIPISFVSLRKSPAVVAPVQSEETKTRSLSQSRDSAKRMKTSMPHHIEIDVSASEGDISFLKYKLQTQLMAAGMDVSKIKDAVIRLKRGRYVSIFAGSDAFERSRRLHSYNLLAAAQKRGIKIIL